MQSSMPVDIAGRRRSPATLPEFHCGRPPRHKGLRYPADPPSVEEIIAADRQVASRKPFAPFVEGTDWEFSECSVYDLGQAVAHMSIQAQALGLHVRQFRAFDRDGIATEFAVLDHWEVTTLAAIGRAASGSGRTSAFDDTGKPPVRARRALDEILCPSLDPQPPASRGLAVATHIAEREGDVRGERDEPGANVGGHVSTVRGQHWLLATHTLGTQRASAHPERAFCVEAPLKGGDQPEAHDKRVSRGGLCSPALPGTEGRLAVT